MALPPLVTLVSAQSQCCLQCMVVHCVHCCYACCVLRALVTVWRHCCHLRRPAQICQTPCQFGGLVGYGDARLLYAATSPYPASSSPYMVSSLSSTLAGADVPIALLLRTALFVRALPVIKLVVALLTLAYLPLLHLRHCQHRADIFALHVLASSPQLHWLLLHCNAACNMSSLQSWRLCKHCAGVLASIALAPLPVLCWGPCPCYTDVTTSIALASSPSMRWHRCLRCAGVIALVALASAY